MHMAKLNQTFIWCVSGKQDSLCGKAVKHIHIHPMMRNATIAIKYTSIYHTTSYTTIPMATVERDSDSDEVGPTLQRGCT